MIDTIKDVELIFWNLPTGAGPLVESVTQQLRACGFDPKRAPEIAAPTAFSRAADALRGKTTLIRPFTKDGEKHIQVDVETVEESGLRRDRKGVYFLSGSVVGPINGACLEILEKLRTAYQEASIRYIWSDISTVVANVLKEDGQGAYSPKKSGGVYFAPTCGRDVLDRLETFCRALDVRFLRYIVPDTSAQRAEVSESIFASLTADIDGHASAVDAYEETSKPGWLDNRSEAIDATLAQIGRLRSLLSPAHVTTLEGRITSVRSDLAGKAALIAAYAEAQPRKGRRIIVDAPETTEATPEPLASVGAA